MRDKPRWEIIHGDSLTVLESFPPGTFDAVITDPPYASGGRTQAEKSKATAKKYSSMGGNAPPDFDGDAKDQRSWTRWAAEWLYLARRAAKPGAPVCMFIDWRQLPCASSNGRAGSGAGLPCGIRETPARKRVVSDSRQNTLSGVQTEICRSAAPCRACRVCSNTAIRRTAST